MEQTIKATKSELSLDSSIITTTLPQINQQLDLEGRKSSVSPIANNGIIKEGGVTELYETTVTQTNATTVYVTSTGNILKLNNLGAGGGYVTNIYVNDGIKDNYIGQTSSIFLKRYLAVKQYYDVVISSDNQHGLGIYADATGVYLDEFILATQVVTQTATVTTSYNFGTVFNAVICRANSLTFASAVSTSGFMICTSISGANQYVYIKNSTVYAANGLVGNAVVKEQADNLTAFYCGGTVVWSALVFYTNSYPAIYTMPSPYTTPTVAVLNSTYNGCTLGTLYSQPLDPTQTTLKLVASGSNANGGTAAADYSITYQILISAAGAVTFLTEQGNTRPNFGGTAGSTACSSVYNCPYGSSGLAHNSTPNYGQWNQGQWTANNVVATSNVGAYTPELLAPVLVQLNSAAITMAIEVKSYKGLIGILSGRQITGLPTNQYTGNMINDFGGGSYNFDIMSNSTWNTINTANVFYPFDYRNETVVGAGSWMAYKRNDRKFVLCQFTYNANQQFTEIGRGIVSLNTMYSNNSIIDCINMVGYDNCSAYTNSFQFNFTSTAASMAYFKKYNLYSSSIDAGLMYLDYNVSCPHSTSLCGSAYSYSAVDFVLYNGSTGAYVDNCSTNTLYYNTQFSGTYVNSAYVPPACDAKFINGGVQLFSVTAMAQPNYFGYQLGNLLPIKYKAIFALKGFWYVYDGNTIFTIPFPNGLGSVMSGVPVALVTAQGYQYLDCSTDNAYFLDTYDNSLWAFGGGRQIQKLHALNMKSPIQYGVYSDYDNALYMITTSSIITLRDSSVITENTLPYGSPYSNFSTYDTEKGVYFLQNITTKVRSYYPPSVSTPSFSTVATIPNWGVSNIICSTTNNTNLYVGGSNGTIGIYNGSTWTITQIAGWLGDVLCIASDTGTNIIAAGKFGQYSVSTNSGTSWSAATYITGFYSDITALVSTAAATFHVFGYNGLWNKTGNTGSSWGTTTPITGWTAQTIYGASTSGASNIVVVGTNGYSSVYNGTTWTAGAAITGITTQLNAITYSSISTQWILCGTNVVAYSANGTTWTVQSVAGNWNSITSNTLYANLYTIVGNSGSYTYSTTATPSWTTSTISGFTGNIYTTIFFMSTFWVFGVGGQYSTSFPVWGTVATLPSWSNATNTVDTATSVFCYSNTWIAVGTHYTGSVYEAVYSISTNSGSTWTSVAAFPSWNHSTNTEKVTSIFCYLGTWIAVGTHYTGSVYEACYSISTNNGSTWSTIAAFPYWNDSDFADTANSIFCYLGTWIAVGTHFTGSFYEAVYSISTNNGSTWTSETTFPSWGNGDYSADTANSIFCYLGTWIAVGTHFTGSVYEAVYSISTNNGSTWTSAAAFPYWGNATTALDTANSIFCYLGTWIAVGKHFTGSIYEAVYSISTNSGSTWTSPATFPSWSGSISSESATSIFCYLGTWVAVGKHYTGSIYESVYSISTNNGSTWSTIAQLPSWNNSTNTENATSIYCYSGTWIAVGQHTVGSTVEACYALYYSDGSIFNPISTISWSSNIPYTLTNNSNILYSYGTNGYTSTSSADVVWSTPSTITNNNIYVSITNSNVIMVAGANGYFAYSTNGITYNVVSISGWIGDIWYIAAILNTVIVVGQNGQYAVSTNNGVSFTAASTVATWVGNIYEIANDGNSTWMIVGSQGQIATSTNSGTSWTVSTVSGFTGNILCVAYINSTFVIGGVSGQFSYSINAGSTWATVATISGITNIYEFQQMNNNLVAVGSNNGLSAWTLSTTNGQTWSTPVQITSWTQTGIVYDITTRNNEYTLVGTNNLIPAYSISNSTNSAIIPLTYQTGYMGYGSNSMYSVSKVIMRLYCLEQSTSTLNIAWNWVTQDNSGTDYTTINTTPLSQSGYFTAEYTMPDNNVLMGSLSITDASATQKLTLLNIDVYTTYKNEANISNKCP